MRPLPVGHAEVAGTYESSGGTVYVMNEAFVGGSKLLPEIGELSLSLRSANEMYIVPAYSLANEIPVTDEEWMDFQQREKRRWALENIRRRRQAGFAETLYWKWRHTLAREWMGTLREVDLPNSPTGWPHKNAVDRLVNDV